MGVEHSVICPGRVVPSLFEIGASIEAALPDVVLHGSFSDLGCEHAVDPDGPWDEARVLLSEPRVDDSFFAVGISQSSMTPGSSLSDLVEAALAELAEGDCFVAAEVLRH